MKLLLIRHGAAKENLEHRFLGLTDSPLCQEGIEKAAELSGRIQKVEHIYVSPLVRCRQTASLLWPEADQTIIDDLRETDFGPFEGKCHRELVGNHLYELWIKDENSPELAGLLENTKDALARASAALSQILIHAKQNEVQTAAVVSHGGTLMGILSKHVYAEKRDYYAWSMENLGGYIVHAEYNCLDLQFLGTFCSDLV